jgi:PAS domain S-box-containing protein
MTTWDRPDTELDPREAHVQDLRRRLAEAEGAVQALITGQVDAVLDTAGGDALLLQRAQAALRESESRYRWLAAELAEAQQIAHVGSWQWDVAADQVTCSDELLRIFDRPPGGPPVKWSEFLENVYPDDRPAVQAQLDAALRAPGPFSFDHRIRRATGGLRYLQARGVVKLNEAGMVVRVLGTCHDVSRWVVAQAEIRLLNAELEERVRRRTAQLEAANQALERDIQQRESVERALQSSRDQLSVILRGAADGITAQGPDGRFIYANEAAARLLGYESPAALMEAAPREAAQHVTLFDEDGRRLEADRLPGRLALALHTGQSATICYRHAQTGSERWTFVKATPIFSADGQAEMAVSLYHDVTELKRAEREQRLLAEAGRILAGPLGFAQRLASIARLLVPWLADWCAVTLLEESQPPQVAVAHADPAKNPLVEELQRRYPPEAESTSLFRVLRTGQAELYPDVTERMLRAAARDETHWHMLQAVGLRSAMLVPLMARGRTVGALTCVRAEAGRQYSLADLSLAEELARRAALAVDNARLFEAERQARAEAQHLNADLEQRVLQRTGQLQAANAKLERSREHLRRLSSHLQTAREDEQMRIAREIHDELGQTLTALKMDAAWLRRHLDASPATLEDKVASMSSLIDTTIQTVRKITQELRPGILDDLGLLPALEWQLQDFQQHSGLACSLRTHLGDIAPDTQTATTVFRIFQEMLTNIARHAGARRVDVTVSEANQHLVLEVRDDGRGITDSELAKPRSFGLLGMNERVTLLGGRISIRGEAGRGTTVTVSVPLRAPAPKPAG